MTFFADLFAELEPVGRFDLLALAEEVAVGVGEQIIEQGCPNLAMYVVLEGAVRVEYQGEGGVQSQLATLYLGAVFGEMSFLTQEMASASVYAEEDTTLLRLDHQSVADFLAKDVEFASRFYQSLAVTLAERLRESIRRP